MKRIKGENEKSPSLRKDKTTLLQVMTLKTLTTSGSNSPSRNNKTTNKIKNFQNKSSVPFKRDSWLSLSGLIEAIEEVLEFCKNFVSCFFVFIILVN